MTKRLMIVLYLILSLSVITCEKYTIKFSEIDDTVKIDFVTEILPIFDNDCKICHTGGQDPNLSAANAYDNIFEGNYVDTLNPESSALYSVLLSSGTHSGRTSNGNMQIILAWISQGALYSIDGTKPDPIVEDISFWMQIVPIFEQNNCTDCHGTGQTPPDLVPENAYTSLIDNSLIDTITPENSGLYTILTGAHNDKLSVAEKDTILYWIDQGAIDDTPPSVVSLSQHLQPIFNAECIGCHASGSFMDLTTGEAFNTLISGDYVNTTNPENSKMYKTFIGDGSHVGRTSDYNVQLILSWIGNGALDNK